MSFLLLTNFMASESVLHSSAAGRTFHGPLPLAAEMRKLRPIHAIPAYEQPTINHMIVCRLPSNTFAACMPDSSGELIAHPMKSPAEVLRFVANLRAAVKLWRCQRS